jgi:leader peptidase (prepilin peptidase)/N-methyltransferase
MATNDILRAAPHTTALRIRDAWLHSQLVARAAALIGMGASVWVPLTAHVSVTVRIGLAISGVLLALAALVDSHERRLPNRLVLAAAVTALSGAACTGSATLVIGCIGGAALGGSILLAVRLARGIGMGDVKMAAAIGAGLGALSLTAVALGVAIGATIASGYALATRRSSLPLGPSLWGGWCLALALPGVQP